MKQLILIGIIFLSASCSISKKLSSTNSSGSSSKNHKQTLVDDSMFLITEISNDKTYGLSPRNPVEVGGAKDSQNPSNERRYLNALEGPSGEAISYYRSGSCCPVKSDNDPIGFGKIMLDRYLVTWKVLRILFQFSSTCMILAN